MESDVESRGSICRVLTFFAHKLCSREIKVVNVVRFALASQAALYTSSRSDLPPSRRSREEALNDCKVAIARSTTEKDEDG